MCASSSFARIASISIVSAASCISFVALAAAAPAARSFAIAFRGFVPRTGEASSCSWSTAILASAAASSDSASRRTRRLSCFLRATIWRRSSEAWDSASLIAPYPGDANGAAARPRFPGVSDANGDASFERRGEESIACSARARALRSARSAFSVSLRCFATRRRWIVTCFTESSNAATSSSLSLRRDSMRRSPSWWEDAVDTGGGGGVHRRGRVRESASNAGRQRQSCSGGRE